MASYVEKPFRTQQGDVCAFCGHFVPTFPSFYPVLRIISATRSHLQLLQFTLSGQEPDLVLVVGWLFGCVLGVGFGRWFWGFLGVVFSVVASSHSKNSFLVTCASRHTQRIPVQKKIRRVSLGAPGLRQRSARTEPGKPVSGVRFGTHGQQQRAKASIPAGLTKPQATKTNVETSCADLPE